MDGEKRTAIDWQHFDWSKVEREIDGKELSEKNDELENLPRDMFVEFIRHIHDDMPELYQIMLNMLEAKRNGDDDELDKWKQKWEAYGHR